MAESDLAFVEKIFEPVRELILAERDGRMHLSILPSAQFLAEDAIDSPELWIPLAKKARLSNGKERKEAHAALCYGMTKLLGENRDFPPVLRNYLQEILLKECRPGKKHRYRFALRNYFVESALRKLPQIVSAEIGAAANKCFSALGLDAVLTVPGDEPDSGFAPSGQAGHARPRPAPASSAQTLPQQSEQASASLSHGQGLYGHSLLLLNNSGSFAMAQRNRPSQPL